MSSLHGFKQKLAIVSRLWEKKAYTKALALVESLLKEWPGNAHLLILWASLVQLEDNPNHGLDEAKRALMQAADLDKFSPSGAIELGHFLDSVEDDPKGAFKAFAEGVATSRRLLIEGLMGQARVLIQLGRNAACIRTLLEATELARIDAGFTASHEEGLAKEMLIGSSIVRLHAIKGKSPYSGQLLELLNEFVEHAST